MMNLTHSPRSGRSSTLGKSLFRTLTPLALLAATAFGGQAYGQHKTGLDFQFDLRHTQGHEDSAVEGDRNTTQFVTRRARWYLSGKTDIYSYRVRFKFKDGNVNLSDVKVGYKLSPTSKITFGRGFSPLPIGSTAFNSRMSDNSIYTGVRLDKGAVGAQYENKFDDLRLRIGVANTKAAKWANGVGGTTKLTSFGYGIELTKLKGTFKPRVGIITANNPSEKIKAGQPNAGYKFHGANRVAFSVGTALDFGATDIYLNYLQRNRSKVEESLAGGPKTIVDKEKEGRAYELRIAQKFTSMYEGSLHLGHAEFKEGGKKAKDSTRVGAQLFMYPYGHQKAYFTLSLIHKTEKKKGEKREDENEVILTASARPSYVIAKK